MAIGETIPTGITRVIRSDDGIAGLRGGRSLVEQLVQEIAVHAGDLPRVDGRLSIEALRNGFMIGHGCGDLGLLVDRDLMRFRCRRRFLGSGAHGGQGDQDRGSGGNVTSQDDDLHAGDCGR